MKFKLLNTYSSDIEANIVAGRLETDGIKCMLENEIFSSIYPIGFNSIGGIKLLVAEDDYDRAIKILASDGDY